MIDYNSPLSIRAFLEERGIGIQKRFGQNFMIDGYARAVLINALNIRQGDVVWEIGPGLGAVTAELLERGALVTAFEVDRGFCALLREMFGGNDRFTLVEGDVLKSWRQQVPQQMPRQMPQHPAEGLPLLFGNLPYNIAATVLACFIEKDCFFRRAVITVQKEVGERIIASPSSKNYSSISVLCASVYTVKPLRTMKGASFYPAPKIDSLALCFDIRNDGPPQGGLPALFRPMVRALFSQRRKTIRNNLCHFIAGLDADASADASASAGAICDAALTACGIPAAARSETLPLEKFIALARVLGQSIKVSF
jgi:16S rRNA (adenine1518-N6/adenine1519-N6)-dimethyltransferase